MGYSRKVIGAERQRSNQNISSIREMMRGGLAGIGTTVNYSGIGSGSAQTHQAEQLSHYRGYTYSVIKTIVNRSSDSALKVAALSGQHSDGERSLSDSYVKSYMPRSMKDIAISRNAKVLDSHRILDVFTHPNSIMTRSHLSNATFSGLEVCGVAHWWCRTREETESGEDEIWPLPAPWLEPIHGNGTLFEGWNLRVPGAGDAIVVPAKSMVYFYNYDIRHPLDALSPLQQNANAVLADEYIEASQKATFKNAVNPSVALIIGKLPGGEGLKENAPAILTKEQRNALQTAVMAQYASVVNDGKPLILDDFIKDIKRLNPSVREMDFLQSSEATQYRISQGWGVNPVSMGKTESQSRANSAVADDHLLSNVINPKLEMVSEVMTRSLPAIYAEPGEELLVYFERGQSHDADFDLALETAMYDRAVISVNEWRHRHDLPPIKNGDVAYVGGVPIQVIQEDQDIAKSDNPNWSAPRINTLKSMKSVAEDSSTQSIIKWMRRHLDVLEERYKLDLADHFIQMGQKIRGFVAQSMVHGQPLVSSLVDQIVGYEFVQELRKVSEPHLFKIATAGAILEWELHVPRRSYQIDHKGWLADVFRFPKRIIDSIADVVSRMLGLDSWIGIVDTVRGDLREAVLSSDATHTPDQIIHSALGNEASTARAERISGPEALGALGGGQQVSRRELSSMNAISVKTWVTRHDDRVRPTHRHTENQTVGVDDYFDVGGEKAMYPGDPSLSAGNRCNCFPGGVVVEGIFDTAMRSSYSGKIVEIVTRLGRRLSLTPNHPVLTKHGFVAAGDLDCGDNLVAYNSKVDLSVRVATSGDNVDYMPAKIEDVLEAFVLGSKLDFGIAAEVCGAQVDDFDGDGRFMDGDIEIVRANRKLLSNLKPGSGNKCGDGVFPFEFSGLVNKSRYRSLGFLGVGPNSSSGRSPGSAALFFDKRSVGFDGLPFNGFRFGLASQLDASLFESCDYRDAADTILGGEVINGISGRVVGNNFGGVNFDSAAAKLDVPSLEVFVDGMSADVRLARNLVERHAAEIELDEVVDIRFSDFAGHVYDLQSPNGFIVAEGIVTSNCRCISVSGYLRD